MNYLRGLLSAWLTLTLVLSGCAFQERDAATIDAPAAGTSELKIPAPQESEEAVLRSRLASRSREVGQLRLQLLAKQAEINQLLASHERALQDALRANARVRGNNSKAETVAAIAEAALLIKNARESARDDQQQALDQAEKLLESGRSEMLAGNLDAASYLAVKALGLAQVPDYPPANQSAMAETLFTLPIDMVVKKQSNVRAMPGIGYSVLFQLAKGVRVKALGYSDLRIRILTEDKSEGWIYYNLLETIAPGAAAQ